MDSREVVLRSLELVAGALAAETDDAALAGVRADLEVLDRADLLRVAAALAVDVPRYRVAPAHRASLAQRVEHARLELTWEAS